MKRIYSIIVPILGFCLARVHAQDTVRLELTEAIRLGKERSVQAKAAESEYLSAYWAYRTYRTELLPEVVLSGTVPYYSKSFNTRQNEDGSWNYVENNYNRIDAGISVTQNIPWTGGKITVGSSFERLRQYGDGDYTHYRSIPGTITLEQPLFGFNRIKWLQRIEPVKYREASRKRISDREEVTLTVIQYYFDLLAGQTNLDISVQNRTPGTSLRNHQASAPYHASRRSTDTA
ncbi:MAG: TolC family protein [Alistipes sp.]